MNAEKLAQRAIGISAILSSITLLCYVILGFQMRMVADDYCFITSAELYGPFGGAVDHYLNWGTRYTLFFILYSLAPLQPSIHVWLPIISMIIFVLSLVLLLHRLFKVLNFKQALFSIGLFTVLLSFTYYRIMPSYQHAMWFSAVFSYFWLITFMLLYLSVLLIYLENRRSLLVTISFLIITVLMVILLTGLLEVASTLIGAVSLSALLIYWFCVKDRQWQLIAIILANGIGSLVSIVIVLLSPGAESRREILADFTNATPLTPLTALPNSLRFTIDYIFGELYGVTFGQTYAFAFLANLFLFIVLWGIFYLDRNADYKLTAPKHLLLSFILSGIVAFIAIFAVIYPAVYAASGILPMRPVILPRFIQLMTVCYWAYLAIAFVQRRSLLNRLRRAKTWSPVLIAISILLIWSPAVSIYRLASLYPDYQTYAQSWDARHDLLLNTEPNSAVILEPLSYNIEESLVLEVAGDNPNFWINGCVAGFYNLESITVEE